MTAIEFNSRLGTMYGSLELFTLKFTKDPDEAADLVQETMLKAFKYKEKFKQDSNLKAWLFTIMKNTFINNYRKLSKWNFKVSYDENPVSESLPDHSFGSAPEKKMEYKELMAMVENLKEKFRIPFILHHQGFKYQEISKELNLPLGTVKTRIFYARQELQRQIVSN